MPNFAGWQKHLHLALESTWGELAGSPTYLYLPYAQYDVQPRIEARQSELFTGLRQRRHHRVFRAALAGALRCPLYGYHAQDKSIAEHLLDWLTSGPADVALSSYTGELFEADADNKRHLGLRPAAGTIVGSAAGGAVELAITLQGKEEEGGITAQALDPAAPIPTEFLFKDCTFTVNSVAAELESFEIEINNNLEVHHNNSYWPSVITAGVREVRFALVLLKTDDVYDALRRSPAGEGDAQLVLKGAHNGTGPPATNFTTITIDLGRLGFADATEIIALSELQRQNVEYLVLKPSTTANDLAITYDAVA